MSTRVIDETFEREVGAALLAWIGATRGGRWESPCGGLDYIGVTEGTPSALVRDFVSWASGYSATDNPGARERMEQLGDDLARLTIQGGAS